MWHESTQGNRSPKIPLNWIIFYVVLILETRLIKNDLGQCLICEVLKAAPSCICLQELKTKLCSMGVMYLVLILERLYCLLKVEFCFPKSWLCSGVARET